MNSLKAAFVNATCYQSVVIKDKSSGLSTTVSTDLAADSLKEMIAQANNPNMSFSHTTTVLRVGDPRIQELFLKAYPIQNNDFAPFYIAANQALYYQAVKEGDHPPYPIDSTLYRGWANTTLSSDLNRNSAFIRREVAAIKESSPDPFLNTLSSILKKYPAHPFTLKACCLYFIKKFPDASLEKAELFLCKELGIAPYAGIDEPLYTSWIEDNLSDPEKALSSRLLACIKVEGSFSTLDAIIKKMRILIQEDDPHPVTLQACVITLASTFKHTTEEKVEKDLFKDMLFPIDSNRYNAQTVALPEKEKKTSDALVKYIKENETPSLREIGAILNGEEINPITLKSLFLSLEKRFPDIPSEKIREGLARLLTMPMDSSLYAAFAELTLSEKQKETSDELLDRLKTYSPSSPKKEIRSSIAHLLEDREVHFITLKALCATLATLFDKPLDKVKNSLYAEFTMPLDSSLYMAFTEDLTSTQKEISNGLVLWAVQADSPSLDEMVSLLSKEGIHPLTIKALFVYLEQTFTNAAEVKKALADTFTMSIESDLYAYSVDLQEKEKETSDALVKYIKENDNPSLEEISVLLNGKEISSLTLKALLYSLAKKFPNTSLEAIAEDLSSHLTMPIGSSLYAAWNEIVLQESDKEGSDILIGYFEGLDFPPAKEGALSSIANLLKDEQIHLITLKALFLTLSSMYEEVTESELHEELIMPIGSSLYNTWALTLLEEQKKTSDTLVNFASNLPQDAQKIESLSSIAEMLNEKAVHPLTIKALHGKLSSLEDLKNLQLEELHELEYVML